jgi:putative spermidine/putrescine transport system ATP-binding protein
MAEPLVEFCGIRKSYDGETCVVDDLDLQVRRGEFLTLLGPSGSGKTTALMMLAGFERPTDGRILLAGRDIARLPPHKRDIGVVFQNYALFPHMTVAENVAFPLKVRRRPRAEIEAEVNRALSMTRLEALAERRPGQLSGGQQQRAALARALVFNPALVVMDEPLGALDKNLREQMQQEIKTLHVSLGLTIVYVTHDQSEALTMSDRIAVFQQGRVVQLAEPREVYERPGTLFVARFLGENNCLPARFLFTDGPFARFELSRGQEVLCQPPTGLPRGGSALVVVRPEDVRIARDGDRWRLAAEVASVVYHGDHVRIALRLAGGEALSMKGAPAAAAQIRPGDRLNVSWPPDAALSLRHE